MPAVPPLLLKLAQAQMTDDDLQAFRDIVSQQKENARQRELRREARFARNRADRVREAKTFLMLILGLGGAAVGRTVGGAVGAMADRPGLGSTLGALGLGGAGLLAGNGLGRRFGNRTADRMEQIERDTGVRVNEQQAENAATQARDLAMWSLLSRN